MNIRTLAVLSCVLMASAFAAAQAPPQVPLSPSPRGSAAIEVGGAWSGPAGDQSYANGKWITVDYGRPILRGRQNIFGTGADYGKTVKGGSDLWRAGANDSTRLTTQVPLIFGTKTIQPGVYNVLVDLKDGAWTFVLSMQPIQPKYDPNEKVLLYGAYNYDPTFDVLRVPMRVSSSPSSVEQFTISFVDVTAERGSLVMSWDRTVAAVEFRLK